ncbi:MAG: aminotransferase class IV [Alphaproteobacteria bacterium]|nr:aminotransferase class IV [Alphaproteobacteria bacterium]
MSLIYLNGNIVPDNGALISHKDCGFTTGIGIFDSMLAKDGKPIHVIEHFERIMHDCETVIGLKPNLSFKDFCGAIAKLISQNADNTPYARIRTTITGGVVNTPLSKAETPTVLIDVAACNEPDNTPITCAVITDYPRIAGCPLENCKRLDYSRSYAARRKAEESGAEEALLTNTDGNVVCGATSNLFIEESGILITPPLVDGVLAGVTRRKIIEERDVKEESISLERLNSADKVYLTNSFIGLRTVNLVS